MSDAQLRELERAWGATGALEDEARYLSARVRSGELALGRVELAAWLGHPGARAALGVAAPAGEYVPWQRMADAVDRAGLVLLLRLLRERGARWMQEAGTSPWRATISTRWGELEAALAGERREVIASLAERTTYRDGPGEEHYPLTAVWSDLTQAIREVEHHLAGRGPSSLLRVIVDRQESEADREAVLTWALGPGHDAVVSLPAAQDEQEWLRARLASGELDAERLRVAAHCGHQAAAAVLAGRGERSSDARDTDRWVRELFALDPEGVAEALLLFGWMSSSAVREEDERVGQLHERLLQLTVAQDEERLSVAREVGQALRGLDASLRPQGWRRLVAPLARRVVNRAPELGRLLAPQELARTWIRGALATCDLAERPSAETAATALAAFLELSPEELRAEDLARFKDDVIYRALVVHDQVPARAAPA